MSVLKYLVNLCNGILFHFKTERIPAICDNMNEAEDVMLNEISQTENTNARDLSYMWNLKQSNSQKQKVEWRLPGTGAVEQMVRYWSKDINFQL